MQLDVCVAGLTGWTGQAVARAIHDATDMSLVSGVSRRASGSDAGAILDDHAWDVPVYGTVEAALTRANVLVDYTSHLAVKANVMTALDHGVSVVVGASGLSAADYDEIDRVARDRDVGVIAAGNYSLTATLAATLALLAARYLPHWEIVDYASDKKLDSPSGTARELAERLGSPRSGGLEGLPSGSEEGQASSARGQRVAGTAIHSVRVPGFSLSTEVVFGLPGERLSVRHDAGDSAEPYVAGTLLAIRNVRGSSGLTRGLESLLL